MFRTVEIYERERATLVAQYFRAEGKGAKRKYMYIVQNTDLVQKEKEKV